MRLSPARCDRGIGISLFLAFASSLTYADDLVFQIDPARTELMSRISVTPLGGIPGVGQGDNMEADRTTYEGNITVRVDDPLDPTSITFLNSDAEAVINGDWLPELGGGDKGEPGTAMPANYGMFTDDGAGGFIFVAIRNANFIITSEALPVDNGMISTDCASDAAQCLNFFTNVGTYDYNVYSPNAIGELAGSQDFAVDGDDVDADNQEAVARYEVGDDGVTTITLPLLLEYNNDLADFFFEGVMVATYGTPMLIPGDANGDGQVDSADLNIVGINWQMDGKMLGEGDFTGDGIVNSADLNVLGLNWQRGVSPAAAVPEPGTGALLAPVLLIGLYRRRSCDSAGVVLGE